MKNITYLLFIAITAFVGCSGTIKGDSKNNDKGGISIIRFDQDMYNYITQTDSSSQQVLIKKYPLLLPIWGQISIGNNDPSSIFSAIREYFSHPELIKIYKDELEAYKDVSSYENELNSVSDLVSKHLPEGKLPQFAMHVSGFKENVIVLNNLISLSAEKYMGSNYPAYKEFFKPYERQQMDSKYIVRDYIKAWIISDVIKVSTNEQSLLSAMVTEGKILYALSILLPENEPGDIIGYSPVQLNWCTEQEKSIWQTLVKQNYLYTTDHMVITRFVNDAPYTAPISEESPGRVGAWVGWQIVSQYAKKKGASLEDIIRMDAQSILKDSKYNP